MNSRQKLQVRSLKQGLRRLAQLPDGPEYAELRRLRKMLAASVATIESLSQRQGEAGGAVHDPFDSLNVARRAIRAKHLLPVSRRAKLLFKHDPDVLVALKVPPARGTLEEHALAAFAMAKALGPHAQFCHEENFQKGFLTDLKAAGTKAMARAKVRESAREAYSSATRRLQEAIRNGRELGSLIEVELKAAHHRFSGRLGVAPPLQALINTWPGEYKLGKPFGRPKKRKDGSSPPP